MVFIETWEDGSINAECITRFWQQADPDGYHVMAAVDHYRQRYKQISMNQYNMEVEFAVCKTGPQVDELIRRIRKRISEASLFSDYISLRDIHDMKTEIEKEM